MKILIISDTHREDENMMQVIEREKPFDVLIHLGDAEGSETLIPGLAGPDCACYFLRGNNDFFSDDLATEMEIDLSGHHIFLTHGHYYNVSLGVETLAEEARERGCDIAMFGHTHRPYLDLLDGVTLINPGSLSYPRQHPRRPSYMVMEMDDKGVCYYHERYLDD